MSVARIIKGAIIGASVLAGYSYYLKMKKTEANLEVIPEAKIYSVNWNGITIQLDVLLKNPSKGNFSIRYPFIKLAYKNNTVGSSKVIDKEIAIPAYGEVRINKILVTIPIISIFSVSHRILKAVQNGEYIKITATMTTTINLGLVKLPFEESHEITLKK